MALKFIEWMDLPEDGERGTRTLTNAEIPGIKEALGRGEPVLIGLVFVARDGTSKAWENHQVLAYAADQLPMDVLELRIYDPNYPGDDDCIIRILPTPDGPRCTRVVGRRSTHVRGLFRMPYVPVTPPAAVAGGQ